MVCVGAAQTAVHQAWADAPIRGRGVGGMELRGENSAVWDGVAGSQRLLARLVEVGGGH